MKSYKDLQLNYSELAYIMGIPVEESKEMICQSKDLDKAKVNDFVSVEVLRNHFGKTVSHDPRHDKKNDLVFNLNMKAGNYKSHLNDVSLIKKVAFTGGKTIFYKILSEDQITHAMEQLKMKHIHLFGIESYEGLES